MKSSQIQRQRPVHLLQNTGASPMNFTPYNSRTTSAARIIIKNSAAAYSHITEFAVLQQEQEILKHKELACIYLNKIHADFAECEKNEISVLENTLQILSENLSTLFNRIYPEQPKLPTQIIKIWFHLIDFIIDLSGYRFAVCTSMNDFIIKLQKHEATERIVQILEEIQTSGKKVSKPINIFDIRYFVTFFILFSLSLKCHDDTVLSNIELSRILSNIIKLIRHILSDAKQLDNLINVNSTTKERQHNFKTKLHQSVNGEKLYPYNKLERIFLDALNFNLNLTFPESSPELDNSMELMSPKSAFSLFSPSSSSSITAASVGSNSFSYVQSTNPEPIERVQKEQVTEALDIVRSESAFEKRTESLTPGFKRPRSHSF